MKKRDFLKGMVATAAGLMVPAHVLAESKYEFRQRVTGLKPHIPHGTGVPTGMNVLYGEFKAIMEGYNLSIAHPNMTSHSVNGFVVSASSESGQTYSSHDAFYWTNPGSAWLPARQSFDDNPEYIQMEFPEPLLIKALGMQSFIGGAVGGGVKRFRVLGMNNKGEWEEAGEFESGVHSNVGDKDRWDRNHDSFKFFYGDWFLSHKVSAIRIEVLEQMTYEGTRKANPRILIYKKDS